MHERINQLRKDREGGFTSKTDAEEVLTDMLSKCSSDTYLFIDQPGVKVDDFQQLATESNIPLWTNLKKFAERCSTIASFPRLDNPVDLEKMEKVLRSRCGADTVLAMPRSDPMFKAYDDTKKRVIRLELDPLPEDELEREIVMKRNDDLIIEAFKLTPSPFFSIIYTSSEGEEFIPKLPEHKKQKHLDIFSNLVRARRDPKNKYHVADPHPPRKRNTESPSSRIPPLKQKKKRDAQKKAEKDAEAEKYISKETVGLILVVSAAVGAAVAIVRLLNKAAASVFSTKEEKDAIEAEKARKSKKKAVKKD